MTRAWITPIPFGFEVRTDDEFYCPRIFRTQEAALEYAHDNARSVTMRTVRPRPAKMKTPYDELRSWREQTRELSMPAILGIALSILAFGFIAAIIAQ